MNNFLPPLLLCILISMACTPFYSEALPKFKAEFGKKPDGTPRIRLTNQTTLTLACYISIDGYKKKFVLAPFKSSRWYAAANNRYDHTSFRTWCDSLEFHPEYKKYHKF